jgi:hypothetical protein
MPKISPEAPSGKVFTEESYLDALFRLLSDFRVSCYNFKTASKTAFKLPS